MTRPSCPDCLLLPCLLLWTQIKCCVLSRRARAEREFVREMRALAHLRHPNIIAIMGAVVGDGLEPLMVMELMELGRYDSLCEW